MTVWVLMEDMEMFFEGGYYTLPLNGEVRPNWALETVTVNFSLLNPLITKENVEIFYNSFVQQIKGQKIIGKKNIVIFQCDSRSPGTIQSSDEELQKSFMLFHNYVKYRGLSLGYFSFLMPRNSQLLAFFGQKLSACIYSMFSYHTFASFSWTLMRSCSINHSSICAMMSLRRASFLRQSMLECTTLVSIAFILRN